MPNHQVSNWKKRKSLPPPLKIHFPVNLPNICSNLSPKPSSATYAISGPPLRGARREGRPSDTRLTGEAAKGKSRHPKKGKSQTFSPLI